MLQRQGDVLGDAAPRQQREILEDEGQRVEAVARRLALEIDAAIARLEDAADDAEQGGFAAAGRADHGDDLALADMHLDVLEHEQLVIRVALDVDDHIHGGVYAILSLMRGWGGGTIWRADLPRATPRSGVFASTGPPFSLRRDPIGRGLSLNGRKPTINGCGRAVHYGARSGPAASPPAYRGIAIA